MSCETVAAPDQLSASAGYLQDAIPEVAANSLAGVVAKLEMIAGADRDIGDPIHFP
jgi:hypothetical protein